MKEFSKLQNNFKVVVMKEEVVAPALPMQSHWLPLSNLDLLLPSVDVGVFFCYANVITTITTIVTTTTTVTTTNIVVALKKALTQALVSFYPLAGELAANSAGELELLCNNRGVDFVEAVADVELRCLNLYNPDESIEGKLVPTKKHGVLAVQATFLKCGSLVVGCSFDHRIADAYSANMFLVSWAEMARPTKPTISSLLCQAQPCFHRSLLNPRRPGYIHPSVQNMYVPYSNLPLPKKPEPKSDSLISRIYYVKAHDLNHIESLANSNFIINGMRRTKLESFCAFLWKIIASSAKDKRVIAKMGIVVDGRKRLINGNNKERALLMSSYFGNVISLPFGGKPAKELTEKPFSWVASEVHAFLEAALTEEHFLGLIDWVEAHRPSAGLARIYCGDDNAGGGDGENDDGPSFVVSSGQRFPMDKVDFGWGKPVFGSYHFPWGGDAGYVMPMPSPAGKGDWVVYMHLRRGELEMIECEAAHVFKPLTWDCLI